MELTTTAGEGTLTVAFREPDLRAPISNYEYSLATWTLRDPAATGSPVLVPGLPNGVPQSVNAARHQRSSPGCAFAPGLRHAVGAGLIPAFTAPVSTGDGFTVDAINYNPIGTGARPLSGDQSSPAPLSAPGCPSSSAVLRPLLPRS